ncbi:CxxH/CxxC protein [Brevibacillus dissolubilis]|uniref:CxxH/CxxC protein n=1 Tax=Brevibacillus dissolubilis TaxID=1844116 RepID=UPI001117A6AC|nr:CxxH/CxxC protein [Brevibacillus dissolubilis]
MTTSNQDKTIRIQGKETPIHAEHPVRISCMECIDRELDDYVNNYEAAPDTFKVDEVDTDEAGLEKKCMVCGAEGNIALLHVKGM